MAPHPNERRPALFLDRDGVLNEDLGYTFKPEDMHLLPGVGAALQRAQAAGFWLLVISNQSGVARGLFGTDAVDRFNAKLNRELTMTAGVAIDGFFYCPHHPAGCVPDFTKICACRKPEPGLVHEATSRFAVDLSRSFFVGDKPEDMECAQRAGLAGLQIKSRYGDKHPHALARVESLDLALRLFL